MSITGWVFLGVMVLIIGYTIVIYNGLVNLKHAVSKNLSNIDILLKQRHDELPKLVETCKQYMAHEKETLIRVIDARSQVAKAQKSGDMGELGKAEALLRGGLGQLFAVAENYPDLKADANFGHLQTRVTQLENAIADRRELYNESVNNNNVRIEEFPDAIVANMFNFKEFQLLEFAEEEKRDLDMKSLFS